jgi:heavy metal sensor kinase
MSTWPLRWRIAAWAAAASGITIATFTAVITFNLYTEQVEMIDHRLAATATILRAGSTAPATYELAMLQALIAPAKHRRQANESLYGFALVRRDDGHILQANPPALALAANPWPPPREHFSRALDGKRLRLAALGAGNTTLILAASLEPADESAQDILGSALIALPIVLLVVAAGSWWIARRAMQPIVRITEAAAAINAHNLGARLPELACQDEIAAHVRVLNAMFDRLQRSFEQATRFTADAAHELRTPLTILRGQIEDALRSTGENAEHERLLVDLLEETTGLQKVADNLLLLSRLDTGRTALARGAVDLTALTIEGGEDAELLATPRGIAVATEIAPDLRVQGDATMLRRVLLNLIDNAIKFNRPGGSMRLGLRGQPGWAELVIGNSGPGIPEPRRAALFERFYRAESDRNREAGGSGLGLSLCREIVVAHGGTIALGKAEADWTEFSVRLPRLES